MTEGLLTDEQVRALGYEAGPGGWRQTGGSEPAVVIPEAPIHKLEVLTAREILELPDPSGEDELLGALVVRRQRVVIGAHTGHGKTTAALQIVRAVVRGEDFLGWQGTGGRALVVDAEQGLKTIKRRLREAGLDGDDVDVLRCPDGLMLDRSAEDRAALEAVIATGYDIVLADPHYKLHGGDSNAERETVELMRILDGWRESYGFALLLAVHCRKPPPMSKFSMHEFFGSSALLRGAEVVLGLQMLSVGYSKLHFFKDRDGDLPLGQAWGLLFDREAGFRRDPKDGQPRETALDRVRETLEDRPGLTQGELATITGYAERTVREALKELGAAEVAGGGKTGQVKLWSLPEDELLP
jgi:hypothetical protein